MAVAVTSVSAWVDAAGLQYRGGNEKNSGTIEFVNGTLRIHDSLGINPGAGCQTVSSTQVNCGGMKPLNIDLGQGNDIFRLNVPGARGYIQMGAGDDTLYIGSAHYSGTATAMAIQGGGGSFDLLTYEQSSRGVYASMDGIPNDGRSNDGGLCGVRDSADADNVHPSFEAMRGSGFGDRLSGRDGAADRMEGGQGSDCLYGWGGDDVFKEGYYADETDYFVGMEGFDTIDYSSRAQTVRAMGNFSGESGSSGEWNEADSVERVIGGSGNDNFRVTMLPLIGYGVNEFHGGPGDDTLIGDSYDNTLYGGPGADHLEGGSGADILDCGEDRDTVRLPELADTLISCEILD
ncbi:hypothetical protein [Actinokineospora sp. HUAS TT18]|uniref:hypothetical protein n=1 Tax=Actinokineospora sp. HUAS TT18 TaxID=3447451 RepID=UPI003F523DE1